MHPIHDRHAGSWPRAVSRRDVLRVAGGALALSVTAAHAHVGLAQTAPATVVASGLVNPKGFIWGSDGTLYVAEADRTAPPSGTPAAAAATPAVAGTASAQATLPGIGTAHAGARSGQVVKIASGCPVTVASGFASSTNPDLDWSFGVSALAFLGDQLYALVDGGGASTQNQDFPNGLYTVNANGTATMVADLSAWIQANEVAQPHEPLTPDGEPFGMIADGEALIVTESNHEQLLRIAPDGSITRLADFSPLGDTVPTGIVANPDGGYYIGFLSPLPFETRSSRVMKVAADGTATDVWTGLTATTGVALGPDGTLYAAQLSTGEGTGQAPPFVVPGSGKVVRQTGPSSSEDVAIGLSSPTWLAFGPDGGLYVNGPGIGAFHGEGQIIRLAPDAGQVIDVSTAASTVTCAIATPG